MQQSSDRHYSLRLEPWSLNPSATDYCLLYFPGKIKGIGREGVWQENHLRQSRQYSHLNQEVAPTSITVL
jgi:hypothetical protein